MLGAVEGELCLLAIGGLRMGLQLRMQITGRNLTILAAKVPFSGNATRTVRGLRPPGNPHPCASPRGWRFVPGAALFLTALLPLSTRNGSAAQFPNEYQVKAAYLFNLLKFVEWPDVPPADPHAKWVIGFAGGSPISDELARQVEGKNVLGRELEVKKFQSADNLRSCHILFISASEKKRLPSILAALRGSSVLTVGDMDDFTGSGGMIQLLVENERVRLTVDVGATSRARLRISSKMLSLARAVTESERSAIN